MKKLFLFGVLAALVAFSATGVRAQDVTPAMSKEQVTDLVAHVYDAPAGKFLLKQLNGPDNRGFRVVFVHNGKRYTLDHNWWVGGVQVWVRPNGTSDPRLADAFADEDMDGIVDFGTDGNVRIFVVANHYREGSAAEGLEHRPYWQKAYDEALAGLQATLR